MLAVNSGRFRSYTIASKLFSPIFVLFTNSIAVGDCIKTEKKYQLVVYVSHVILIRKFRTLNEKEICVKYASVWLYSNSDSGKLVVDVR